MTGGASYPLVQLRYVSQTGTGHTPSRSRPELWVEEDRTVRWMTLADVGQLRAGTVDVISETAERITPAGVASSSAVIHPAGTVFLSRTASVGFSAMMGQPMAVSQDFMTWTPGPLLDGRFLLHVLRGMRPRLLGLMYGSTHKTIYMPDLLALRTPLPPVAHQREIARFLDLECERIVALSAAFSTQRGRLEELRSVLTHEAVAGLRHVPLKYAASVIDCKHRTAQYVDAGLPLISTREVTRGALVVDDATRRVTHEDFVDLRDGGRDPRRGDIIYSRNASVGIAAYLSDDIDVCMGQDVVLITRRPKDSELLCHVLNWAVADQVASLSIGSTFSRINVATIRQLLVPDDDPGQESAVLDALRQDYSRLDRLDAALTAGIERLGEYRDALISEAVAGQLDVTRISDSEMDERARAAAEGAVAMDRTAAPVG